MKHYVTHCVHWVMVSVFWLKFEYKVCSCGAGGVMCELKGQRAD